MKNENMQTSNVGAAKNVNFVFNLKKYNPTLPVTAVTKHFPRNNIKSPKLLIVATCKACVTKTSKA